MYALNYFSTVVSWSLFVSSFFMMFESFILCLVNLNVDYTFN